MLISQKHISMQPLLISKITLQLNLKGKGAPGISDTTSLYTFRNFIFLKFLKLPSTLQRKPHPLACMSAHFEACALFTCSVSAGELEDQSVVLLILGSPEVSLHQSTQIKAASCLIHLLGIHCFSRTLFRDY